MKKALTELSSLGWTLAGTFLVLITLSGQTRRQGIMISAVALVVHIAAIIVNKDDSE